jgi:putative FmdB family regulatory protein
LPIYTYACHGCDAEIERRQSFSDAPLTVCESCGGQLRRVLHPVGIIFKGSGFHNTDYKKSSNGAKNGSAEDGKSETKASDSKPSESKSGEAKASESKPSATEKSSSSSSTGTKTAAATSSAE